jgi:hypothetical protein
MILSTYSEIKGEERTYFNDEFSMATVNLIPLIDTDRTYSFLNTENITIMYDGGGGIYRFNCTGEEVQDYLYDILKICYTIKRDFKLDGDSVLNMYLSKNPDGLKDYIVTGIEFFGQYSDSSTFAKDFAVHNEIITDEYSDFLDTDKYLSYLINNDQIIIVGDYYFIP